MTIWKRIKRLWTLLTTEEVFESAARSDAGRWYVGRLGPRERSSRRRPKRKAGVPGALGTPVSVT
jgi:hypothetical protein